MVKSNETLVIIIQVTFVCCTTSEHSFGTLYQGISVQKLRLIRIHFWFYNTAMYLSMSGEEDFWKVVLHVSSMTMRLLVEHLKIRRHPVTCVWPIIFTRTFYLFAIISSAADRIIALVDKCNFHGNYTLVTLEHIIHA